MRERHGVAGTTEHGLEGSVRAEGRARRRARGGASGGGASREHTY